MVKKLLPQPQRVVLFQRPNKGEPFPVSVNGHGPGDEEETQAVNLLLHKLREGSCAFPAIPIAVTNGCDFRVASNGRFAYWCIDGRLYTLDVGQAVDRIRRQFRGGR
jgi:hypothetical protein